MILTFISVRSFLNVKILGNQLEFRKLEIG